MAMASSTTDIKSLHDPRFGCSIASAIMGVLRFRKKKVGRGFARF